MTPQCPVCHQEGRALRFGCAVCQRDCCRDCCKRYLAMQQDPTKQVRMCNECFLGNVAWDASRTYDTLGPCDGKPVVLVHGALIGRQCLIHEARALADVGFRVIVPDLPAHGALFRQRPLTLDSAVATLHSVIQQEVPGKKVVMMGFSMGGYVTAAFAAAHPDMVCGVLLAACAHDTHTLTWKLVGKTAEAVYRLCSYKTKSQFIYKGAPDVMDPRRPEVQEAFLRAGAEMDAWRDTWRVMYDADMAQLLPKITCPALLVVGEHDFRSHEQRWLQLLPHGSLLVLRGGQHAFMLQPGVCRTFRLNAEAFAAACPWDASATDGLPAPYTPFACELPGSEDMDAARGVQLPSPSAERQQPGCCVCSPGASKHGVGVRTLFSNLAAQRRRLPVAAGGGGGANPQQHHHQQQLWGGGAPTAAPPVFAGSSDGSSGAAAAVTVAAAASATKPGPA